MSLHFRSRIVARLKSTRPPSTHLVYWSPREKILHCTCPGFNYRRVCSATRLVLSGRVR